MKYQQKHPETCLAKSLMILLESKFNKKIPEKYELDLLFYSLKYNRENIAHGHIEKIVKDFKVSCNWFVDSKIFFDFMKGKINSRKIKFINQKINLKFIDTILDGPIIIYLDRFYLWEKNHGLYYKYHYPHFIIINKKVKGNYEVIDPDDGIVKMISSKTLSKAIISLRNHLWISPQVIKIY